MKTAIFRNLCPNCGGSIGSDRLQQGLPCRQCLPDVSASLPLDEICSLLKKSGKINNFKKVCDVNAFSFKFASFFKEKTGFRPWSLQLTWTKRVAMGRSFSLIAPTGIGKTTWGIMVAAFLDGRSYIVVPTRILVKQVREKIESVTDKKIVAYTGNKEDKKRIFSGDFDVLITTTNFLYRNYENIPRNFDFIFIDDVDSVLKSGRNVDKVLKVAGFSDEAIEIAMEVIDVKRKLAGAVSERLKNSLLKRLEYLETRLKRLKSQVKTILVVSSATASPRSKKVRLFRELLDFDVGRTGTFLRNVEDIAIFTESALLDETLALIKRFGKGVFVFVSEIYGKNFVNEVVSFLQENGIAAVSYEEFSVDKYDDFRKGKIEAVVGIASYRNPLARGVDIPDAVRYAVFVGVPRMRFPFEVTLSPSRLFTFILICREFLDSEKVAAYLPFLRKYITLPEDKLENYPSVKAKIEEIANYLKEKLSDASFLTKLKNSDSVFIEEENGRIFLIVGDSAGYIQASGRTSRMFAGGLTKGVSFLIVDSLKAFNSLRKRLLLFLEEVTFKVLDTKQGREVALKKGFEIVDFAYLSKVFQQVNRDRMRVKAILEGKLASDSGELVKPSLVIVESPHKARTIASFFGNPVRRRVKGIDAYEINAGDRVLIVTASKGHVFDLTVKDGVWGVITEDGRFIPVYDTIKRCQECGYQGVEPFCPRCGKPMEIDKAEIVEALRSLAIEVDDIFVASDPDTEGEKIGWDIALSLKPYKGEIKRAEFHEITRKAFTHAVSNPRDIDENLVKAQIVRRIADRWVGFSLSQNLQKFFGKKWLSAGRVQTPVLGWVIDREEKSKQKRKILRVTVGGFVVEFPLDGEDDNFRGESNYKLVYKVIEKEKVDRIPPPPFNTGDLIKTASFELGYSAQKVMTLAQELFEGGYITYHRTDSIRVSSAGIGVAREFILENFGEEYFKPRKWGEGGAHECIRPVRPMTAETLRALISITGGVLGEEHLKLYELIFKRFIASQMIPFTVELFRVVLKLVPSGLKLEKEFYGKILKDGWNLMLPTSLIKMPFDGEEGEIQVDKIEIKEEPSVYPFTQGELVEEMKKRGIGRPSTYAKIVQTLLDRKYVVEKGRFLYSTSLGRKVYDYLSKKFSFYVSESFTRELERLMDMVEEGSADYQRVIDKFKNVLQFADTGIEVTVDEERSSSGF
ncbi:reverse gyrase [Desulfurobacterium sp.]